MDWSAALVSMQLALVCCLTLLPVGLGLGWYLGCPSSRRHKSNEKHKHLQINFRPWLEAFVMLPLLLPPTVLGFYFLQTLAGASVFGVHWVFSFEGLCLASFLANMPLMVQPIQRAFANVPLSLSEMAWTCGASRWRTFWQVELPLARPGVLMGLVLTAAHTVGEFGVVLVVGGGIPQQTRTLSIAIYDSMQQLNTNAANQMALVLLCASVFGLAMVFWWSPKLMPWSRR